MDFSSAAGERPLAVAFLSPAWPLDAAANGILTYVDGIVSAFLRLGHTPSILTANAENSGRPAILGLPVFVLRGEERTPQTRLRDAVVFRVSAEAAKQREVSAAIVRAARHAIAEQAAQLLEMEETFGWARLVKPRLPIPVVVRLHGPHFSSRTVPELEPDRNYRRRVREEGRGIVCADAVSAPSRDILERTRAQYQLPLADAAVIPCPAPIIPSEGRWRQADCDFMRILFVGRFDRLKGADVVIESLRILVQSFPRLRLWFAGPDEGLLDEQGRLWTFAQYVAERAPDVAGSIDWLGLQPNSALAELRRRAFLTIVASRYETFGQVVLEAMAHGCPLVAAAAGGITEIVEDDVNGLLCRPGDPFDLAAKMKCLFDAPERAARLGQRAGEDAARLYHPDAIARQTVTFYRGVLARS